MEIGKRHFSKGKNYMVVLESVCTILRYRVYKKTEKTSGFRKLLKQESEYLKWILIHEQFGVGNTPYALQDSLNKMLEYINHLETLG